MTPDRLAEIRGLRLFKHVSDNCFESLMQAAYVQNFPPLTELITQGDSPDFLHIVLTGSVELFSEWERNETTIATVWPVSTFIVAATISSGPYLMSARTREKSRIAMIPSEDVKRVFEIDAEFAKGIVAELANCYRASIQNISNLKLRNSKQRLANYLLKAHRKAGIGAEFNLKYEKRRLASYLGMTPENLSRAFNALREYGVQLEGQKVMLEDLDRLIEYAKPTVLIDG